MKRGRKSTIFFVLTAAVLAAVAWIPSPVGALSNNSGQSDGARYAAADVTNGVEAQPEGKHSRLPDSFWESPKFWNHVRDPFKPPTSQQLCSAGFLEACARLSPPDSEPGQ
ncbi:MAG TPA: hypothetical protein VK463_13975 [Desulfomonilaceae bacterium]|nr:hypothetical protein [Desulfomonilaceae bacterium]